MAVSSQPPVRPAEPVRRRDPEAKRRRILATAADLLARDGYAAMTSARLAAAAGVSEGLIFHHFGSKRGVLLALASSFGSGAFEAVAAAASPEAAPRSAVDVLRPLFAFAAENRTLVCALDALAGNEDRALAVDAVRAPVVASLVDLLVRQEDLGGVRPMDPQIVAELLFSMVTTALAECFVRGDGSARERWLLELSACVDAVVLAGNPEQQALAVRNR